MRPAGSPEAVEAGRPKLRTVKRPLRLGIVATAATVLGSVLLYGWREFAEIYRSGLAGRLEAEARLLAATFPWDRDLDALCARSAAALGVRVTVIADDGRAMGDSEVPARELENHATRPEILQASRSGAGRAIGFSGDVGRPVLYVAVADDREGRRRFVRVAAPLLALEEAKRALRRQLTLAVAAVLGLGAGAAWARSRRAASRLERIERALRRISQEGSAHPSGFPAEIRSVRPGELERRVVAIADDLGRRLAAAEGEKARLETVLGSMSEGVLVLDPAGRVELCNESARQLLDLPPGPMGFPKLEVLCREPQILELAEALLRGRDAREPREVRLSREGSTRTLRASGAALPDRAGAVLVLHDVTRLRELERVRADFVANVSHELRTPLTAIRGYAETLLEGAMEDPSRARPFLQVIVKHACRLGRLIDDLLVLSDLELGRSELDRQFVELQPIVTAVFEALGPQATARSIALRSECPEDLPRVFADPDRLEQVLLNLVDNGIKYSDPGREVTVAARSAVGPDSRPSVAIEVRDQGIGIPEHEIPRLTERFYRVDKARSRELGGTGLGLAIVKHIVQAHGGSLSIESRVGRGTTVTVSLPAEPPS